MNVKLKEAKEQFAAWCEKHFSTEAEAEVTVEEVQEPTKDKFETVLLVDGETEVTIEPAIEVGAAIVLAAADGTPVAAPAGEYELQDGRIVVVEEDGVIAAIQEAAGEVEEEPMATDEPEKADKVKREIERIEREKIFSKEEKEDLLKTVEFLKEENEVLKKDIVELKEFTKQTFDALLSEPSKEPVEDKTNPFKEFTKTNSVDAWMEKHLID